MSQAYPQLVYEDVASFSQEALDVVATMSEFGRLAFLAELQRTYASILTRLLSLQSKPLKEWSENDIDFARVMNNPRSTLVVAGRWVRIRICKESYHWRVEEVGPDKSGGTCFQLDIN